MSVVDRSFNYPMQLEEHAVMPLAGGILAQGYQCGMLWGAALAAGAQAYRLYGPGPQAESAAIQAAQRLVGAFRADTGEINCLEISEINFKTASRRQFFKYFVTGGPIACFRMAARYAKVAFDETNATFSGLSVDSPTAPVSCAGVLAQKLGLSEQHTVMASGFAGGIGLSGGACGALGLGVWVIGLSYAREGVRMMDFDNPRIQGLIEKFLESSDYRFECSEICGRRFEKVGEHSAYVQAGGCAQLIEALAAATLAG